MRFTSGGSFCAPEVFVVGSVGVVVAAVLDPLY